VNFPAVKADVSGCRFNVLARNLEIPTAALLREFAALLRGVVFIGEAALCQRFDFQRSEPTARRSRKATVTGVPVAERVGKDIVRRARKATGASAPVAKRIGKDGKARPPKSSYSRCLLDHGR
jgi:hypothetical protein